VQERVPSIVTFDKRKLQDVLKGYTYFRDGDVLLAKITPCFQNGKCVIAGGLLNGVGFGSTEFIVIRPALDRILPELVYHYVSREHFIKWGVECMTGSAGQQRVPISYVADYQIPLPLLDVQRQIVAELDGYRKIIEGSRQVIANYKPTIKIDPAWPMVNLNELAEINRAALDPAKEYVEGEFVYIDISSVENGTGVVSFNNHIRGIDAPSRARRVIQQGDVLLSTVRPNLRAFAYLENMPARCLASTGFAVLTPRPNKIIVRFLWLMAFEDIVLQQMVNCMGKGSYPSINQSDVKAIRIPLPPLENQRQIVAEIEVERALVESNQKLVELFEQKIQDKLAEIWGEVEETA